MLTDKKGNRMFRKVDIRVVYPTSSDMKPEKIKHHAPPGKGFNEDGIHELLMVTADQLDTLYPWWEFRLVELSPEGRTARFVFTFDRYRSVKATESGQYIPAEVSDAPTV